MRFSESSILNWILDEVKENDSDAICVVCKGGERVSTSRLLLAAISPYLAQHFDSIEPQDVVVLMPDVTSKTLTDFFHWMLAKRTKNELNVFSDQEVFTSFDGIFWRFEKSRFMFPLSRAGPESYIDITRDGFDFEHVLEDPAFKEEEKEDDFEDDFDLEAPLIKEMIKYEHLNHDKNSKRLKEEATESKSRPVRSSRRAKLKKRNIETPSDDDCNPPKRLKKDCSTKTATKTKKKSGKLAKKKPKAQVDSDQENFVNEADNNDNYFVPEEDHNADSIEEPLENNTEKLQKEVCQDSKRKIKRPSKKKKKGEEGTDDPDFDLESGDESSEGDEGAENKAKKKRNKSNYGPTMLSEEEMPKDEAFLFHQQKLRLALQDDNVDVDPRKFWHEMHGFNEHTRFSKCQPKLICPLCPMSFPWHSHGRSFFNHLQDHKIKNFKCPCQPTEGGKHELRRHVKAVHWKYKECEFCQDMIDPDKLIKHISKKHQNFRKELLCNDCGSTFSSEKFHKYQLHMEQHKADKFECDCDVIIKSRRQKLHHVQVVHVKQMFGCDECYFVFYDKVALQDHHKKMHVIKNKSSLVCDICGFETRTLNNRLLKEHKMRMHDPVLEQCQYCPVKLSSFALKEHVKLSHEGAGICNLCGVQVIRLKMHMKAMHNPAHLNKHKCTFCPKAFYYANDLKRHQMSVHLKERPFKCRFGCEFAYNDSSNRNQHEKKKHGGLFKKDASSPLVKDE